MILGLLTGVVSWYYIKTINRLEDRFLKYREKPWKKFVIAGLLMAVACFFFQRFTVKVTTHCENYYMGEKLIYLIQLFMRQSHQQVKFQQSLGC